VPPRDVLLKPIGLLVLAEPMQVGGEAAGGVQGIGVVVAAPAKLPDQDSAEWPLRRQAGQ
jgi:hypothetical protein